MCSLHSRGDPHARLHAWIVQLRSSLFCPSGSAADSSFAIASILLSYQLKSSTSTFCDEDLKLLSSTRETMKAMDRSSLQTAKAERGAGFHVIIIGAGKFNFQNHIAILPRWPKAEIIDQVSAALSSRRVSRSEVYLSRSSKRRIPQGALATGVSHVAIDFPTDDVD